MGPTKTRVLQAVRDAPGSSTTAIARAVQLDGSTVDYHLRSLARQSVAVRERVGREIVWFARSCRFCPVLRRVVPAFRRPGFEAVGRALGETPKSCVALAQESGVAVGSVRWIAGSLVETGLAVRSRSGRVALREGAQTCVAKAASASECDLWGLCPVSRALGAPPATKAR